MPTLAETNDEKRVINARAHSHLLMYFEKNQLFNRPSPRVIENFSSFSAPALIKADQPPLHQKYQKLRANK